MRKLAPVLAAALALSLSAAAAPPIDDPEARIAGQLVSPVVISTGPAWWEVSKGGRTVQVLGVLWSYPPDRKWNQRVLERRLRGSRAVLFPAALSSLATSTGAVVDNSLPPGGWDDYPKDLKDRVAAAAKRLGKPVDRYMTRPPMVAGYLLVSDFREGLGLKNEVLLAQTAKVAQGAGIDLRNAAVLPLDRYLKALSTTTNEASRACVEAALGEVETGEDALKTAVDAWSAGDVATALGAPRGLELCGFAVPGQADLRRAAIDAQVTAIAGVLDEPRSVSSPTSRYVAVANLRTLVAEGGVLDKLRQRGYQVRSPRD